MFFSSLALLVVASVVLAAPTADSDSTKCHPDKAYKVARYDDLPFNEPGPTPIPPHYYGLSYITFQVDQYDGWIPPTSGNQTAIAFGGSGNITVPDS